MQRNDSEGICDPQAHFDANIFSYAIILSRNKAAGLRLDRVPTEQNGLGEGIVTYLNPLYAYIESMAMPQVFDWAVSPFHRVDPTGFIETHDYMMRVLLTYGFAATKDRLVPGPTYRAPLGLVINYGFPVPQHQIKMLNAMMFRFGKIEFIEDIYFRSGIENYVEKTSAMRNWSDGDLCHIAREALFSIQYGEPTDDYTHTALYDIDNHCWRFVPFRPYLVR